MGYDPGHLDGLIAGCVCPFPVCVSPPVKQCRLLLMHTNQCLHQSEVYCRPFVLAKRLPEAVISLDERPSSRWASRRPRTGIKLFLLPEDDRRLSRSLLLVLTLLRFKITVTEDRRLNHLQKENEIVISLNK